MSTNPKEITLAEFGPINDDALRHLRDVAYDAVRSQATEHECLLLLTAMGPLLDELLLRRNTDFQLADLEAAGTIVLLEDYRSHD